MDHKLAYIILMEFCFSYGKLILTAKFQILASLSKQETLYQPTMYVV